MEIAPRSIRTKATGSWKFVIILAAAWFARTAALASGTNQFKRKKAILQEFGRDVARLSLLRPADPAADISSPVDIISAGSTYTKLWTQETWLKHADAPHVRYRRHVAKWRASKTAQKVVPAVGMSTAWACFLSFSVSTLNRISGSTFILDVLRTNGSSATFSLLGTPLALLLTLRANASIGRLLEARLLWGRLVLHVRSLASAVKTYMFPSHPQAATLAARHLVLLGWCLKAYVRGESFESEQQVVRTVLPSDSDANWLLAQDSRIVATTSRIRQICAAALNNTTEYSSSIHLVLEEKISDLEQVVGGCQRLATSPIPPTYSRHLSRVLSLWILFMPMSFVASGLSPPGVAVATAVSTYVLVGIDEVGMEIERVFQLMPLQELAAAAQSDVKRQFLPTGDMPEVPLC